MEVGEGGNGVVWEEGGGQVLEEDEEDGDLARGFTRVAALGEEGGVAIGGGGEVEDGLGEGEEGGEEGGRRDGVGGAHRRQRQGTAAIR